MHCSEAWTILAEDLWSLAPHQSKAFWFALADARWTRPVAMRQALALVGYVRVDLVHLCRHTLAPAVVIAVIEDLVKERQLRRSQASHIEESVLRRLDPYGNYPGESRRGVARPTTHAPDIICLADIGKS